MEEQQNFVIQRPGECKQSSVHAGMTGRIGMMVGFWNHQFTHVPIELAVSQRKKIDPAGWVWSSVLAATGQPAVMQ